MVVKYAMGEKEIIVQKKAREDAERKLLVKHYFADLKLKASPIQVSAS